MRHLIIEGPDGAGKTTLAHDLCKRYGMAYHHEGPPPNPGAFEHYRSLLDWPEPTVFDRLHVGELVYGPLLRGGSQLTLEQANLLNRKADLVICLPPWETCLDNTRPRDEMIKDVFTMHLAWILWERIATHPDMQGARIFDYTKGVFYAA